MIQGLGEMSFTKYPQLQQQTCAGPAEIPEANFYNLTAHTHACRDGESWGQPAVHPNSESWASFQAKRS